MNLNGGLPWGGGGLVIKSCPTLCDPMDCSLPGPSVHGILQARILECCHALLQGIFPTQGSNPCLLWLLHCRQIPYHWATKNKQTKRDIINKCLSGQASVGERGKCSYYLDGMFVLSSEFVTLDKFKMIDIFPWHIMKILTKQKRKLHMWCKWQK